MKKSLAIACGLLIAALGAGCGTGPAPAAPHSTARSTMSSPPASRSTSPPGTTAPVEIAQLPGGPVPAGFTAASVTFVSPSDAFVLGTAPCQHAPCTSILRTLDRGQTWRGLPAPVAPLGQPYPSTGPAAWGIRFATPQDGFVFGYGLWETTDGGQFWQAVAHPGDAILSLEITDHQVLAVTARHGGDGLTGWTLSRRALVGGPWVQTATLADNAGAGGIATQAGIAAIVDGSSVLVTTDGGLTLTRHQSPCSAAGSPFALATSVAVEAPRGLALLCIGQGYMGHTDKAVYVSSNLGATWTLAGHPDPAGDGGTIAASAPGHLIIATASGASWLYSSPDNGMSWRTVVTFLDGGAGWNDLGFTTPGDGVVVHGHPALLHAVGQLLLTDDGGLSWHAVTF